METKGLGGILTHKAPTLLPQGNGDSDCIGTATCSPIESRPRAVLLNPKLLFSHVAPAERD